MKTITYDPATHKLVPLEPSDEMMSAAHEMAYEFKNRQWLISMAAQYKASVEAAPEAPAQPVSGEPVPEGAEERSDFERVFLGKTALKLDENGYYANPQTHWAYRGWQAHATLPVDANQDTKDAARYRFLTNQDIVNDFPRAGLFIGKIPDNCALTGTEANEAIDVAMRAKGESE